MAPIGPWTSELCAAVVVQVIHSQPLSRRLFSLKAIPGLGAACTSLLLVTPVSLSTIMRDGSKDSKTTRTRYIGVRCFLRCTMNMFFSNTFQHSNICYLCASDPLECEKYLLHQGKEQQAAVPAPFFSLQKLYVDGVACGWSLVSLSLWANFSKKVHEALLLVSLLAESVPFGAPIKLLIWDLRWIYCDMTI